ncbi:uncharacterized protein EV420DRAFT_1482515 [Desarmillaria tabescens]|uniref:Uncharacterized protein n=1 Tax=Armillaria tabescens TaxID=1929756 RepID=A0AA39MYJ3_ARMTA|nr:uncharacterized protein EV420DRAFT_1482515 [Desarmillaria tabescens]KAK0451412.1 hypothetical protein EV420DRAFT_1482515 [Desarmillaria tabescens]
MDDPSHPEEQRSQSQAQTPIEPHQSTSPIPREYSTDPAMYQYQASSTSLQSEQSQEAKKSLWGKAKEALSTSGMKKAGGSKTSLRTTEGRKKGLTPIQEMTGPGTRLVGQESMTLEIGMEDVAVGHPPQLPPGQLPTSPLDQEWLQLVREWREEYRLPGIQELGGYSPCDKVSLKKSPLQDPQGPRTRDAFWREIEFYNPNTAGAATSPGTITNLPEFEPSVPPRAFQVVESNFDTRDARFPAARAARLEQARAWEAHISEAEE